MLIKSIGIKQTELVVLLGLIWGTVNQWLSGRLIPRHKPLMKIYELFPDISADWLLLGREEMLIENKTFNSNDNFVMEQ